MPAEVKILVEGFTNADVKAETGGEEKTCPTITLIRDSGLVMVVDPGVLDSQQILVDRLAEEGLAPDDVDIVCITHSHIDHYRNIGMFPNAKTLEYFGVWKGGVCEEWQEQFTPNIQIVKTPGHDYTSITLFVNTARGVVAVCGDVFWKENYPENDIYATDAGQLKESRHSVIKMAEWIIPGHGKMYKSPGVEAVAQQFAATAAENGDGRVIVCKTCRQVIKRKKDRCECRPYLCYRCCECDMDCDLCSCKHRR